MGITRASYNRIKKHLDKPWVPTLAAEFKLSDSMVGKVMRGERKNVELVKRAIELSRLPEEEKQQYLNKISE